MFYSKKNTLEIDSLFMDVLHFVQTVLCQYIDGPARREVGGLQSQS